MGTWLLLSVIAGFLTWALFAFLMPGWQSANEPALLIVAEVYAALPIAALLNVGGWRGVRDRLAFHFTSWPDIGLAIVTWLVFVIVGALAYVFLSPVLGAPLDALDTLLTNGTDAARFPTATPIDLALILVRAILLSALAEEFLYRGLLFGWLSRVLPLAAAGLITATVFGLQHFYPVLMVLAFLYGIAAAWIRIRTNSTFNTVVMHMLTDGLFLALALFRGPQP